MNSIALLFASLLCFSLINAQCLDVAVPTTTLNPPTLNTLTSTFANDILTIGYNWGVTSSRAVVPTASLGSCAIAPINNGPQSNQCFYSQTVSYNFSELTSLCGWTSLSGGAVLTYGGPLTLIALESYVDFRGLTQTRNLTYTMELSVTFPSFATANTTVEIFSAVLLDVFVTSQIYVTATNKVVGYPFKVSIINAGGVVATGTTPGGFLMNVAANAGTATFGTAQGTQSTQPWDLSITPPNGACFFSGNYDLLAVFKIECALTNVADCPPIANDIVNVTLVVKSESFCFQIASYVSVAATLSSYSNSALTLPATNFLVNDLQTTYFKMVVTSTSVSITNIDIQTIILQASGNFLNVSGGLINSANLYSAAAWQNTNVAGALSSAVANNGIQSFQFDVKNALFAVPLDTSTSIVVQVNATVFYLGGKKRDVVAIYAVGTQNELMKSTIQVSNPLSSNSGFKTQFSFFLGAVLCLAFLF